VTAHVVALEGLPGAGKTVLLGRLARVMPGVLVLPEMVLTPDDAPTEAFFVRNDLEKCRLAEAAGRALLDRAWPSTAAYALAEERWAGGRPGPAEVVARLYGEPPALPTAYLLLDPVRAVTRAYATDFRFGNARFRRELRRAYRDVFAVAGVPVLAIDDRPNPDLFPFLAEHLRLSQHTGRGRLMAASIAATSVPATGNPVSRRQGSSL
jgi:hypothetical protein